MAAALLIIFYLLFPVVAIWLAGRYALLNKLGAVVICYIAGIILGNIGMMPAGIAALQNPLMLVTISLALPLMFFSIDVRRWSRLAGKSLLSFMLQILSILIVATLGFFVFRGWVGEETWKLAGMFVGVYTGGTVNLGAIATALRTDQTLYLAAHTSDVIVSSVYLLILMTVGQRLFLRFLPAFRPAETSAPETEFEFDSYAGIFAKETFLPLLGALGLAVLIFVAGGLSFLIFTEDVAFVTAILTISTLGIVFSFVPTIRKIDDLPGGELLHPDLLPRGEFHGGLQPPGLHRPDHDRLRDLHGPGLPGAAHRPGRVVQDRCRHGDHHLRRGHLLPAARAHGRHGAEEQGNRAFRGHHRDHRLGGGNVPRDHPVLSPSLTGRSPGQRRRQGREEGAKGAFPVRP